MKRLACYIGLVLLLGWVAACSNEEGFVQEKTQNLKLENINVFFDPAGGTQTVSYKSVDPVSVQSEKDWCTVSASGGTITISVTPYGKVESRYSKLTIVSGEETVYLTVQQSGTYVRGLSDQTLKYVSHDLLLPFETNGAEGVTVETEAGWMDVSVKEDSLHIVVQENTAKATRIAPVTYTSGEYEMPFVVTQYPKMEAFSGWEPSYVGLDGTSSVFQNTVSDPSAGMYSLITLSVDEYNTIRKTKSEADCVLDILYPKRIEELKDRVEQSGGKFTLSSFLHTNTSEVTITPALEEGSHIILCAIGMDADGYPTGWYQIANVEVKEPEIIEVDPYEAWIGKWSVPRGSETDTWTVEANEKDKSFKVYGIGSFGADDYAVGAFIAIVEFDAETSEMVFKVYENTSVTWDDSSRGKMNALLSGQYTNVQGKTYYNSGVGNVICRAKMSADGTTADLTPGSVISGGAPASFSNIRWYGRYTAASGSRSGVSWTDTETALPNVMTKQ